MTEREMTKAQIIQESIAIISTYDVQVTLRQLYYRLVAKGLKNCLNSYKRVVSAMTDARWSEDVSFDAFADLGRDLACHTAANPTNLDYEIKKGQNQVEAWMSNYHLHRWENQHDYVEVWVEKQALQGVFAPVCEAQDVGCFACKGYPSLTALYEAHERFTRATQRGQNPVIIYFGDHDPSGDNIPETIVENLTRMGCHDIKLERVALNKDQVIAWNLPPAPVKQTDTRSAGWDGLGQVELDAVEPDHLVKLIKGAILGHFSMALYQVLERREEAEKALYRAALKEYVDSL